jgi:hypothetical protein
MTSDRRFADLFGKIAQLREDFFSLATQVIQRRLIPVIEI